MRLNLWHFLYDLRRKRIELDFIRYKIADGFWGRVFLLHAEVLKYDLSDDVLLFRCQLEARSLRSQKLRMLLTHRKLLQSKAIAIENDLRGTLRNFGLKVGMVGTVKFEGRIKELVENLPDLAILIEPLLIVRRAAMYRVGRSRLS